MIAFMLFVACEGEPPKGWVVSEKTGGPTVVYDVLAEPLADIPLPNNQATRLDPTTATGRRATARSPDWEEVQAQGEDEGPKN